MLQPLYAIPGGAGLYSAIAARMFSPENRSTRVGLILHEGKDFPKLAKQQIKALNMHAKFIDRSYSNTTRGSNVYDVDGNRSELESFTRLFCTVGSRRLTNEVGFAFITPNLKIHASMMDEIMLTSKTYHIICTPSRCIDLCIEISETRRKLQREQPELVAQLSRRPIVVWEPMEDCCRSSEREAFIKAIEHVDVFSPNQRELLAVYDMEATTGPDLDAQVVSLACRKLLEGTQWRAIVARCGPYGCVVVQSNSRHYLAIPAYHESLNGSTILEPSKMVVDPTGGGNAFLGGFCEALSSGSAVNNLTEYEGASFYGNIAASYAIEQFGVPQMSVSEDRETWNGSSPFLRLAELIHRLEERPDSRYGLKSLT